MNWLQKLLESHIESCIRNSPEYSGMTLYRFEYRIEGGFIEELVVSFESKNTTHYKRYTLPDLMQLVTPST